MTPAPVVSRLKNGLRVVTHTMPHLETSSLGVWVGAGARHELDAEHGISHLLEHMAFKGTATRSARDIAEEIEAVGGELNAGTGLETTAYYARVLKGDEGVALRLLADILQQSSFAAEELDREREVILQELAGTKDSPEDLVYDLVQEAAYPDQPAGRSILGTPQSLKRISASDLRGFLSIHYRTANMVVAAAGGVVHEDIVCHAEALFGGLSDGLGRGEQSARYVGGVRWSTKPFEQVHIIAGFEGPSYGDRDFFTAQVFSGLFGGGMSSRLFQEVRERRGLCYAIYSSAWGLKDSGMLAIHAATSTRMIKDLIDVIGVEMRAMCEAGPSEAEVGRAKAQLKAGLLMSLESSSMRAEQMARQLLVHNRLIEPDELVAKVDDVSIEGIRLLANRLFAGAPSVAVVGAGAKSKSIAADAGRRLRH